VEEELKNLVKNMPNFPGVYRMLNAKEEVIYIGKAKDLKKRVRSYFSKKQESPRTKIMVGNIDNIEFTVTNTEAEALILENNLIKKFMPRYNVIFRDDKTYPYLAITGDKYPRIKFHRGLKKKGTQYFGPFPSSNAARESIQLLQKVFMLRTCQNSIFNNRTRPCLEYQIKRCTAPCVDLISEPDYINDTNQAALFLNGKDNEVIKNLSNKMNEYSESHNFERAAIFRDRIQSLRQIRLKQFVSDFSENDADIIASSILPGFICVNVVMIRSGRHLGDKSFFPQNPDKSLTTNVIETFLTQYYDINIPPPVLVIGDSVDNELIKKFFQFKKYKAVKIISRIVGDKRNWLSMAKKNADIALQQKNTLQSNHIDRLKELNKLLSFSRTINRIECFDISHTMGENTVGSCVVYDNLAMQNKDYRRYNISNITPGDDYAAMKEVLSRRYIRMMSEDALRPDLILIDGGKGQFGIAEEIIREIGMKDIFLVGVSKGADRKAGKEKLIMSNNKILSNIDEANLGFHLIQQVRDEAHRFAITGHRARRAKTRLSSSIEDVEGIGSKKRKSLLAYFGGIDGVKNATVEELITVEGINNQLAENIYNYFN
jgi:excinuclease ABC subunit C